jgi:hypothetical protein
MRKALMVAGAVAALVFAAAAGAVAMKVFNASIGDKVNVKGTKVVCGVSSNSTIATALTCFETKGSGTSVGSYAVQIGDRYAAILRVKSKSGGTTPVLIKRQP